MSPVEQKDVTVVPERREEPPPETVENGEPVHDCPAGQHCPVGPHG